MNIYLREGRASDADRWSELWWINEGFSDFAVRQGAVDGMWYLTTGYVDNTHILYGPVASREAIEMLLRLGEFDEYLTR